MRLPRDFSESPNVFTINSCGSLSSAFALLRELGHLRQGPHADSLPGKNRTCVVIPASAWPLRPARERKPQRRPAEPVRRPRACRWGMGHLRFQQQRFRHNVLFVLRRPGAKLSSGLGRLDLLIFLTLPDVPLVSAAHSQSPAPSSQHQTLLPAPCSLWEPWDEASTSAGPVQGAAMWVPRESEAGASGRASVSLPEAAALGIRAVPGAASPGAEAGAASPPGSGPEVGSTVSFGPPGPNACAPESWFVGTTERVPHCSACA